MDKIVKIDGKDVGFRATALTPRIYRHKMGRDIIRDMYALKKALKKKEDLPKTATEEEREEAQLSALDLELFENIAYIMARQYDPETPDTPEEWLDGFNTFSIYEIFEPIFELWTANEATTAKLKKK